MRRSPHLLRRCAVVLAVVAVLALGTTVTALEPSEADLSFLEAGAGEAISLDVSSEGLSIPVIDAEYIALLATKDEAASAAEVTSTAEVATCPAEALKRIGLCQKIVRTFLSPNPDPTKTQIVPNAASWSSSAICAELYKTFPHTVNYDDCQSLAGHVYGASGSSIATIVLQSRQRDIHDMCVNLLSTPFPAASTQRLIATTDVPACSLETTGGLTGLRVLMLHGMGMDRLSYRGAAANYLYAYDGWLGKFPKYWSVQDQMDGIADVRYYVTDTDVRGWNTPALQAEYCAAIAKYNPHVIFTHSMGNNIIAAAVGGGVGACTRISKIASANSILWFSSQAPWTGSPAAAAAAASCAGGATGLLARLKQSIVAASSSCGKELATPSLAPTFKNTLGSFQLADMKRVAEAHVSGALCGLSAAPLRIGEAFTVHGAGVWMLSALGQATTLVNWGTDAEAKLSAAYTGNDGLVAFKDCNLGAAYQTSPSSPFYVGQFSHQDGTCFVTDVAGAVSTKLPCTWYVNRVLGARTTFRVSNRVANVGLVSPKLYMPFAASYPRSFLQLEDAQSFEAYQAAHADVDAEAESEADAETEAEVEAEAEADAEVETEAEAEAEADE